jgi:hypothetical protein
MNQEQISKLEKSVQNMKDKSSRIYFLVQDTKGNAKASVRYIYQMAMTLKKNGYNAMILHEKPDYFGVGSWLSEDYMTQLPHSAIEGTNLAISPEDLIIIPEIYGFVMDQITKLPCGKIVLCQSYDHIFETLNPGDTWTKLGFYKCITTSDRQKEYVESVMRGISSDVISPVISDVFEKQMFPPKTVISVHTRDHRDTVNMIKSFYSKFPQYRWITFRDLRGLSEVEFAEAMKESFCSVWIDPTSAFGTFPLESFKMGIPVIGLVPNLQPEWMTEDNGIWINNPNMMVDVVADYIQNWLEDNINPVIFEEMEKTILNYSNKEEFDNNVISLFEKMIKTRLTSFEDQLIKFETIE